MSLKKEWIIVLKIYTEKPKDKEDFMEDAECLLFDSVSNTEYSRQVIHEVDKGRYLNGKYFIDRSGAKIPVDFLSTSSKILLGLQSCKYIVNGDELGINCGNLLLKSKVGRIYIPGGLLRIMFYDMKNEMIDVSIDNVYCKTYSDFFNYLEEEAF